MSSGVRKEIKSNMPDSRFEFLEIGESLPFARPDAPAPKARDDYETSGPPEGVVLALDGTPLAQVKVSNDPRGYRAYLEQAESDEAVTINGLTRPAPRSAPTGLRAAEVFGTRGFGAGQFNFPTGLAVDNQGILFVADSYNHRLQRITPNGGVALIGGKGNSKGQFLSPQGIATDDYNSFYIVEQGNHRVQKYSADGVLELMFGRYGKRFGEFRGPTGIAVASGTGDIYIADTGNHRVQRFDGAGRFLGIVGGTNDATHSLCSPQSLALDRTGTLFVADPLAHRVLRYDPLGRLVGQYDGGESRFAEPRGVAVDASGLLYVADSGDTSEIGIEVGAEVKGRVLALSADKGTQVASVDKPGRGLGNMARPTGLAVMSTGVRPVGGRVTRGDLYVSDTLNHRILRFTWNPPPA